MQSNEGRRATCGNISHLFLSSLSYTSEGLGVKSRSEPRSGTVVRVPSFHKTCFRKLLVPGQMT